MSTAMPKSAEEVLRGLAVFSLVKPPKMIAITVITIITMNICI